MKDDSFEDIENPDIGGLGGPPDDLDMENPDVGGLGGPSEDKSGKKCSIIDKWRLLIIRWRSGGFRKDDYKRWCPEYDRHEREGFILGDRDRCYMLIRVSICRYPQCPMRRRIEWSWRLDRIREIIKGLWRIPIIRIAVFAAAVYLLWYFYKKF